MKHKTLYTAAVDVSNEFLGPAGERFMRRQISMHLDIEPEELQAKDLAELVEWVRLTFAVLTDDKEHVDDFSNKLLSLASADIASRPKRAKSKVIHDPAR